MFGKNFPTDFCITDADIFEAKRKTSLFQEFWIKFEKSFDEKIKIIYRKSKKPENITCYLNTSIYSMDDFKNGYISVSSRLTTAQKVWILVAHEYAHFLFRKFYLKYALNIGYKKNQIEDLKEILTVLNNPVLGLEDKGYEIHSSERVYALKLWNKYRDLEKVIEKLKDKI